MIFVKSLAAGPSINFLRREYRVRLRILARQFPFSFLMIKSVSGLTIQTSAVAVANTSREHKLSRSAASLGQMRWCSTPLITSVVPSMWCFPLFYKAVCRWCIGQSGKLRRKAESVNRHESRVMLLHDLTSKVGRWISVLQPAQLRDVLSRAFRQARSQHDSEHRSDAEGE